MEQILSWRAGHRFIGAPDQPLTHVATWSEVERWLRERLGPITPLCGLVFRPVWSATILLESDTLCPKCNEKFYETHHEAQT